jgi:stearoyl-CoA desaturase (delta-9 desaturase)
MSDISRTAGIRRFFASAMQWFDADYGTAHAAKIKAGKDRIDWVRCIPFFSLHVGSLGVLWVGWSWTAVAVAIALYLVRMFAVTGFYHRYFSHRTFQTSRAAQFLFAVVGASAAQRGPLWWAYQHRHHHEHSDQEHDAHSPRQHGFWWAHVGWFCSAKNFPTDYNRVRDLAKYPELVWLNRFDTVVPILLAVGLFALGGILDRFVPSLGVTAGQMLVWGFFISTTALIHATSSINSLAHLLGKRRFKTDDDSRNSLLLALITLGEGWHNNHHHYMSSTSQGLYWWEIDLTFYGLKALSWTGLIWNLRSYPKDLHNRHLQHPAS